MAKTYYYNQEVTSKVMMFGKLYYWMKDPTGHVYLARDVDGLPDLLGNRRDEDE